MLLLLVLQHENLQFLFVDFFILLGHKSGIFGDNEVLVLKVLLECIGSLGLHAEDFLEVIDLILKLVVGPLHVGNFRLQSIGLVGELIDLSLVLG